MEYLMSLEVESFIELVEKAKYEEVRSKVWEQWLTVYPSMMKGEIEFISFEHFYNKHFEPVSPKKTDEELIEESQRILKSLSKEMG